MIEDIKNESLNHHETMGEVKQGDATIPVTMKSLLHKLNECPFEYLDYKLPKREAQFLIDRETPMDISTDGMDYKCPKCGATVRDEITLLVSSEIRYCYHCGQRVCL